jgi:Domain of unknown function (DUF5615)
MRFLIDADLPRRLAQVIARFGHHSSDVRDIGLGHAPDDQIAQYARQQRICLITGDWGFADIRAYPPKEYAGIVVIGLPEGADGAQILAIAETLLSQSSLVERLPGRLAIVERGRVRLRPPA